MDPVDPAFVTVGLCKVLDRDSDLSAERRSFGLRAFLVEFRIPPTSVADDLPGQCFYRLRDPNASSAQALQWIAEAGKNDEPGSFDPGSNVSELAPREGFGPPTK